MSGDQLDLDAIKGRVTGATGRITTQDVLALVAEVRRLRALEDSLTEEMSKRREPCGCRRPLDSFGSCCFNGYTGEVAERRFVTEWRPTG